MGVDADGTICFGVLMPNEFEYPWGTYDDGGKYEGEHDKWWEDVSARDGTNEAPIPIEVVQYATSEYDYIILACPSSYIRCTHGAPVEFKPGELDPTDEEIEVFKAFFGKHIGSEHWKEPRWYLSSLFC